MAAFTPSIPIAIAAAPAAAAAAANALPIATPALPTLSPNVNQRRPKRFSAICLSCQRLQEWKV
jgi:hypothetical protein